MFSRRPSTPEWCSFCLACCVIFSIGGGEGSDNATGSGDGEVAATTGSVTGTDNLPTENNFSTTTLGRIEGPTTANSSTLATTIFPTSTVPMSVTSISSVISTPTSAGPTTFVATSTTTSPTTTPPSTAPATTPAATHAVTSTSTTADGGDDSTSFKIGNGSLLVALIGLGVLMVVLISIVCTTICITSLILKGRKNPKKKKSDPSSHWTEETEVTLTNVTEKNEVEDTDNSKPKNGQIENKVTEDEPEVKESKVDDKMEVTVATFGFPEVVIQSPPLSDTVFNGEKEVKKTTDKKPEETEIKKETSSVSGENKSDLEPKEADNESSTLKTPQQGQGASMDSTNTGITQPSDPLLKSVQEDISTMPKTEENKAIALQAESSPTIVDITQPSDSLPKSVPEDTSATPKAGETNNTATALQAEPSPTVVGITQPSLLPKSIQEDTSAIPKAEETKSS